jgi:orotate phosphoribosyltransferase
MSTSLDDTIVQELIDQLPIRRGHFRLESGHHGNLWLDLELLFHRPERLRRPMELLVSRLSRYGVDAVCSPLIEGAFVGLFAASLMGCCFSYASPSDAGSSADLFPVRYVIPPALRRELHGKRVAVVNDVINAGSAVRGTLADLAECGARVAVIGTLAVLGEPANRLAAEAQIPLEAMATLPNEIWIPQACPLCREGVPLSG